MKPAALVVPLALLACLGEARAAPLETLLERMRLEGEDAELPARVARLLDLKTGAPIKLKEASAEDTEDHVARAIRVVLDSDRPDARPVSLVLMARRDFPKEGRSELYHLRLKVTGEPERILFGGGRVDAFGDPVRGASPPQPQELDSRESRLLVRRELDFWLRKLKKKSLPALPEKKGAPRWRGAPLSGSA